MPNEDESFKDGLIKVWRQALVDRTSTIDLRGQSYPVRRTPRRALMQVDFTFKGRQIRALEQNPDTRSRWAQLARGGKKVMQFLEGGRYVANVVNREVTWYGSNRNKDQQSHRSG